MTKEHQLWKVGWHNLEEIPPPCQSASNAVSKLKKYWDLGIYEPTCKIWRQMRYEGLPWNGAITAGSFVSASLQGRQKRQRTEGEKEAQVSM